MNLSKFHGKVLIFIGVMHSLFGLTPWAFGKTLGYLYLLPLGTKVE